MLSLSENVEIYYTINRYLTKKYLTDHHKCVEQFVHLLKEDNKEFPPICPIAYAFVNWSKYLLEKDHFYIFNTRSNYATLNGGCSKDGNPLFKTKFDVLSFSYRVDRRDDFERIYCEENEVYVELNGVSYILNVVNKKMKLKEHNWLDKSTITIN